MKSALRPLFPVACLTALLLSPGRVGADDLNLPDINDPSSSVFSPALDQRIGRAFMRRLRQEAPLIQDPEISAYLRTIGYQLVAQSNEPGRSFEFFLIDNPQINAFAGPGGHIGVHSGLWLTTQTESELASVLAHEISHVTQHHLPRAFEQAQRMSLPTMAAMLGAIILGSQGGGSGGMAAAAAVQAASIQMQIDFTRQNEKEADRVGIGILAASGFNPRAMPEFFQRMHQATRYAEGRDVPAYLRTHPVTLERITDSSYRAAQYSPKPYASRRQYLLLKERLRTLTSQDTTALINYYLSALDEGQQPVEPIRYGLAHAWMIKGDFAAAREQIDWLRNADPHELAYLVAEIRLTIKTGDFKTANHLLETRLGLHPGNTTLLLLQGETLLHLGKAEESRRILSALVRNPDAPADAYQLLARAADGSGKPVEAAMIEAEYQLALGNLERAIIQLREAGKIAGIGFVQLSKIEARLRELEEELKTEQEFFR